jgi:hypothetical protein
VYNPWTGAWNFYGTLTDDTCPPGTLTFGLTDTFYVVQSGTSFASQDGNGLVFTGSMDSDGGFTIVADGVYLVSDPVCLVNWALSVSPVGTVITIVADGVYLVSDPVCLVNWALSVSPVGTVIESIDPAAMAATAYCPTYTCTAAWVGSVSY